MQALYQLSYDPEKSPPSNGFPRIGQPLFSKNAPGAAYPCLPLRFSIFFAQ